MPDREKFENFARDLLGLPITRSPDGKVTYVRPDQYQHRIAARTASEPGLRYVGFDVGGAEELAEWEAKLTTEGSIGAAAPEECVERHVTDFIEFKDQMDILWLSRRRGVDKEPVRYTRDLRVLGLGHVLPPVEDTQRTHDFYTVVLGFRLSDWVCIDDNIRLCSCAATHATTAWHSLHACRANLPGCNTSCWKLSHSMM